jgi:ABC-2 type transport system permease protein
MAAKIWAFYKRDVLLAASYRFSFLMDLARTFFFLLSFFFIGRLVDQGAPGGVLAPYGGDYFRFVLLGVVMSGFMGTALGAISETISFEQSNGTLEAIFLTPTSLTALAAGKILWRLTAIGLKAAMLLLVGVFIFHVNFSQAAWGPVIVVTLLTVTAFTGIGFLSAGCLLAWRESGPLERLADGVSRFLGGVYFPFFRTGCRSWPPGCPSRKRSKPCANRWSLERHSQASNMKSSS